MNGYLVLLSCTMDDFPVLLTEDKELAISAAQNYYAAVPERIQDLFGIDATEIVCTKIVQFSLGEPSKVTVVKDFK